MFSAKVSPAAEENFLNLRQTVISAMYELKKHSSVEHREGWIVNVQYRRLRNTNCKFPHLVCSDYNRQQVLCQHSDKSDDVCSSETYSEINIYGEQGS